ncbi:GvpL/GvpF family gas vesicle protein [Dactylosporangium sp. NPDC051485]|uniref:GvpL/GvpF family gas vesicle protein n=1 Tax=Dactylosporangium sp. NPDC051485 TaxID=3154846 RepID=UPI003415B8A3
MGDGVWLHAIARDLEPGAIDGLAGVAGGTVRTVAAAALVAVASPVDLDQFGEEPLRRNLEDLAWLERVARAHHAVVAALARAHTVVPVPLATVYRDDAGVRAMLTQRRGDLDAVLDRVAGRAEWGVKMYAEPAAPAQSSHDVPAGPRAGGPGLAYLNRRRAQLSADEERWQRAADEAEATHAALAECAAAARRHPPQDRRLSGRAEPMMLNGAYLVDRRSADRFAGLVASQAASHAELHLELTGPWPPYSFAAADEAPP